MEVVEKPRWGDSNFWIGSVYLCKLPDFSCLSFHTSTIKCTISRREKCNLQNINLPCWNHVFSARAYRGEDFSKQQNLNRKTLKSLDGTWIVYIKSGKILYIPFGFFSLSVRPRKSDSEKSVTFERTECATRVLHFISRIFQMKCATDVNDFFSNFSLR